MAHNTWLEYFMIPAKICPPFSYIRNIWSLMSLYKQNESKKVTESTKTCNSNC